MQIVPVGKNSGYIDAESNILRVDAAQGNGFTPDMVGCSISVTPGYIGTVIIEQVLSPTTVQLSEPAFIQGNGASVIVYVQDDRAHVHDTTYVTSPLQVQQAVEPQEKKLTSSCIATAFYDPSLGMTIINFVTGQEVIYWTIPKEVYEHLVGSPSPGKYYNQNIKGKYN